VLGSGVAPVSLPSLEAAAAAGDAAALAKALAGAIRAQYADRLTDAELAVITRQIEASLDRAAKVRAIPLANSHEPDFRFSAVRAADHG
jgi:hypothetical protein